MRLVASLAAVAVLVAGAADTRAPSAPAKGPPTIPGPPLGLVWQLQGRGAVLARLDPVTLVPRRPWIAVGRSVSAWAYDPTHRRLALARNGTTVRLVDVDKLRTVGDVRVGGRIGYLTWLFPARFLAVVSGPGGTRVVWIDADRGRVLQRADLDTSPWAVRAGGSTAVALLAPRKSRIGGARLAVASGDGRVRVVPVSRIQIGFSFPNPRDRGVARRVGPGLAVTPGGEHAFLVGGAGTVAEVDLHTLAVTYHTPRTRTSFLARLGAWLVPTAQAKGVDGPQLQAALLGNGVLAVAGMQYHLQQTPYRQLASPVGLRLIDTRTWTQRTIDDRAGGFTLAGDTLLAFGVRSDWRDGDVVHEGMGVAAYDASGTKRFEALPDEPVADVAAGAGRAYASRVDRGSLRQLTVLDVRSGRVVGDAVLEHPTWLLLGTGG